MMSIVWDKLTMQLEFRTYKVIMRRQWHALILERNIWFGTLYVEIEGSRDIEKSKIGRWDWVMRKCSNFCSYGIIWSTVRWERDIKG